MSNSFIYMTKEKFNLFENEKATPVDSQYLASYTKNLQQINRKKSWKKSSDLSLMGNYMPQQHDDGSPQSAIHTFNGGTFYGSELLYSIQIENSSGMFRTKPELREQSEGHVIHNSECSYHSPCYSSKQNDLVFSVLERDGTENLHLINMEDESHRELTEGDSRDSHPRWDILGSNRFVYQTAGIGRDMHGHFALMGPSSVVIMDMDKKDMDDLGYHDDFDYIMPVLNGNEIYAIRRPYDSGRKQRSFSLLSIIMLPVNIIRTLFAWINFNSMMFRGKPLNENMSVKDPQVQKKVILQGNLVDAEKALTAARKRGEEVPSLVPKSWCLVQINEDGSDTVIEEGVVAFDMNEDGSFVISNGSGVFRKEKGQKRELLFKEKMVQRIVTKR